MYYEDSELINSAPILPAPVISAAVLSDPVVSEPVAPVSDDTSPPASVPPAPTATAATPNSAAPIISTDLPLRNAQDFVGTYDPRIPAGGPIKPLEREEYEGLNARAEEVNTQFACPFPGCDKFYALSAGVDRHLRRDHPDWPLVKDQVVGPDSK